MTLEELRKNLASKKSADRLKAVTIISKDRIVELADELFIAYEKKNETPEHGDRSPKC